VVPAYHAIVLPLDRRHLEALFLRRGPRLRKDIYDRNDRMCGQAHRPREVRDGVVLDDITEVTLGLHRVPGNAARREFARAGAHGNGIRGVPYVRDVVCRRLYGYTLSEVSAERKGERTGDGRCKRFAAMRSPGGSKATTGVPNVTPKSEASAPPSEWPIIHISALGYITVILLYKFCVFPSDRVSGGQSTRWQEGCAQRQ
jgi:hypothetical protein